MEISPYSNTCEEKNHSVEKGPDVFGGHAERTFIYEKRTVDESRISPPILEHPMVGENLADHLHSWATAFTNATLHRCITGDRLDQNLVFAQQELDSWFKNRSGLYSGLQQRTLAITPPSLTFTDSELKGVLKEARANLTEFAREFSNGNTMLAKAI
ncbi:hypothetical protein E1B28_000023 [Marasmius oreades]|uniref:Uncharacterized protein n=1 Tax=Marasmius oreades TaxID=181124 RepID=A0A9P7V0G2_9AGAR|nr:uncharacterized protein E1B28_000023 [Marasmius oreades]KAG7098049.1 hypothetical protein E1B28_000023 [Marasmius oreades]